MTSGKPLEQIHCSNYEVVLTEPLHDLKNLIQFLLERLPKQLEDGLFKDDIARFCSSAIGK